MHMRYWPAYSACTVCRHHDHVCIDKASKKKEENIVCCLFALVGGMLCKSDKPSIMTYECCYYGNNKKAFTQAIVIHD